MYWSPISPDLLITSVHPVGAQLLIT